MKRYAALLLALALTGAFWAFRTLPFVAEDCYFYVVIARNMATRGVQSFWGVEPTNGVHPLWLYVLGGYTWGVSKVSMAALSQAAYAVPLSLALLGIGAANWMYVADTARLPKAVLVFPQVLYLSIFGLLYSEAHASFCALSFLVRFLCAEEADGRPRPIAVGLASAGVFLGRLDSLFFVAAIGVWYLARHRSLPTVMSMAAACAVPSLAYVTSNAVYFGGLAPVSGYLKSTFPTLNVRGLSAAGGLSLTWSGYSVPFGWVPLGLGIVATVVQRRRLRGVQTLLYPLVAGVAGHVCYTAFFTGGFTDWYWYYILPVLLLAWSSASLVATRWNRILDMTAQWAMVAVLAAALFGSRLDTPGERELPALTTLRVVRELNIDRSSILVSEWPGTVAFYTKNDIVAADMLTANRPLVERMLASPNAANVIVDEARRAGAPIAYVLYNGGMFVRPSSGLDALEIMNPRMVSDRQAIGRLTLGPPLAIRDGVVVWHVPPAGPSVAPPESHSSAP